MSKQVSTLSLRSARPWAPRPGIAPSTRCEDDEWIVASNGSPGCYGGWDLVYPSLKAGTWVAFRVRARWRDLERGYDSVNAVAVWFDKHDQMVSWEPMVPQKVEKGYVAYEGRARVPAGARTMVARLLIAWSSRGEVRWSGPQFKPVAAPRPRKLRLGAAGGVPPAGKATIRRNTNFYLGLCEEAARNKIDLLCLPEIMHSTGMTVNNETLLKLSFKVPGKEIAPFQNFARRNRMALCFSVLERNNELVHNTAVLIDKRGKLVGKYRKVHLAQPLELWWGVTPGHEFPVFQLDNAKVAMNICMDSSALESVRVPARKGAEIICLPIMGDHRADSRNLSKGPWSSFDIDHWRTIQCMRAMDNHVYMVISRNDGPGSGIFSPRGLTLAISAGEPVVYADVDLEDLPQMSSGATFRGVCWHERREPTYGDLAGEFLPDPF